MEHTLLVTDYVDQRQESTLPPFYIPAKSLIQLCVNNTSDVVFAFLCSNVRLTLFITSKYLYTDYKFGESKFHFYSPSTEPDIYHILDT